MAHLIGILQGKGGTGRSTISTNLAGALSASKPTALIDADLPQGTCSSWAALRHAAGRMKGLTLATAPTHKAIVDQVQRFGGDQAFIIIDAPPRIAEVTRAVLMLADLVLVPVGPSPAEIWATADLLKVLEEARAHRPQLEARLIWNRVRSGTRAALDLPRETEAALNVPALKTRLGQRVAYGEAMGRGLTVGEWTDRPAREELKALVVEVTRVLKMLQ